MGARLLVLAAGALVALLVALWWTISGDTPATPPPAPAVVAPAPPPAPTPPTASTRARTGTGLPAVVRRPVPRDPAPAMGAPAPQLAPSEDKAPRPITFKTVLSDQVLLTEDRIVECNEAVVQAGTRLSGTAALSFTFARKAGKIVVETTGVEYSSIAHPALLDCMRGVASAITLDELPEGAEAITGYRKVKLEDGKLVENWMTEYSITRPASAPAPAQ